MMRTSGIWSAMPFVGLVARLENTKTAHQRGVDIGGISVEKFVKTVDIQAQAQGPRNCWVFFDVHGGACRTYQVTCVLAG